MIWGTVDTKEGPIIPLVLRDAAGREHVLSAFVDTGFTGWLALPQEIIAALGLLFREHGAGVLADGGSVQFNVYDASVVWDGQPLEVFVDEMDSEPLIGMRLLRGFRFVMNTIDGGEVRIERI